MRIPWRVRRGSEYAASVEAARQKAGHYFDDALEELERRILVDPGEADPITDEDHRVLELVDKPHGYSLALFVVLNRERWICRFEWLALVPFQPDFDPWDDSPK